MMISMFRKLKPGDQVAVGGNENGEEYFHHGIFLSHAEGIIDFGGSNKQNAAPRNVSLMQFMQGSDGRMRPLFRVVYRGNVDPPEKVIERAKEIYRTKNWAPYNLISNNCEHFAVYCKIGKKYSKQVVEKVQNLLSKYWPLITAAALGSAMGPVGASVAGAGLSVGFMSGFSASK